MAVSINLNEARKALENAWDTKDLDASVPKDISDNIRVILSATDVTFKYILATASLGVCISNEIHPRALQAGSNLKGAYDARSLCHNVIVPFEKEHGNLWGLSNEPFLNKPARHPEHSKDNPLRNKTLATILHNTLESLKTLKQNDKLSVLRFILRESNTYLKAVPQVTYHGSVNSGQIHAFIDALLSHKMEGSGLAALIGVFLKEFSSTEFDIRIYPPTHSDHFSGVAGDIEIFSKNTRIAAIECKHRNLTITDIEHGLQKAQRFGVSEYWFVTESDLSEIERKNIDSLLSRHSKNIDAYVFEFHKIKNSWVALLNQIRRSHFGKNVADTLLNNLKRKPYAHQVATIWEQVCKVE